MTRTLTKINLWRTNLTSPITCLITLQTNSKSYVNPPKTSNLTTRASSIGASSTLRIKASISRRTAAPNQLTHTSNKHQSKGFRIHSSMILIKPRLIKCNKKLLIDLIKFMIKRGIRRSLLSYSHRLSTLKWTAFSNQSWNPTKFPTGLKTRTKKRFTDKTKQSSETKDLQTEILFTKHLLEQTKWQLKGLMSNSKANKSTQSIQLSISKTKTTGGTLGRQLIQILRI